MINCLSCNNTNRPGAKFCRFCGQPLTGGGGKATPKLNLFALPTQTTVLFLLIFLAILAAVAASLFGGAISGVPIVLGMLVLPLRYLLATPERERERHGLAEPREDAPLAAELQCLAQEANLHRSPKLLFASQPLPLFSFGSFRRRYLGLDGELAERIKKELEKPEKEKRERAVALLVHELYHFITGDVWMVGYAQGLLRTCALFMGWSLVVSLGLVILALVYTPQMLSPEFRQQLAAMPQGEFLLMVLPPAEEMAEAWEKVENINPSLMGLYVMSAHLPFFVSGLVLYLFFWPRLLKVREFYADAGAASFLRNAGPVLEAMPWYDALVRLRPTPERHRLLPGWLDRLRPATWGLLSFHPSNEQRAECLKDPQKVYGSPARMALRAGLLVLLLEFILTGPFTLFHLRYTPVHFATLTGFVALAVALLPAVCQGGLTGRQWLKRIIGIISIFTALQAMLLLANLALVIVLLIVSPELLAALLELLVYITAGFVASGGPSPLFQADASLNTLAIGFTLSTAIFIITIWGTLISLLLADTYLKRLALTWYGIKSPRRRLVMVCWVITFALAFSAAGLLVPLGIGVVQPGKLSAMVVVGYPLAAGLLIVVGGWLFYRAHRQHGRRCPSCSAIIPGWFYLGKRCPDCGQLLHGWLLADY